MNWGKVSVNKYERWALYGNHNSKDVTMNKCNNNYLNHGRNIVKESIDI